MADAAGWGGVLGEVEGLFFEGVFFGEWGGGFVELADGVEAAVGEFLDV